MLDLRSLTPWGKKTDVQTKSQASNDPFSLFRSEMDRLFDNFLSDFPARGNLTSLRGSAFTTPNIDISESDKEISISAELPGLDEKDFEVTLVDDVLTLKGEKKYEHEEKDGDRHYTERSYGSFSRSVRLPFSAAESDVNAEFEKGILKISIQKPEEIQSRVKKIEVKSS